MHIAYIANYQGPGLLERRPISSWNLSLAANVKIELVAELLHRRGHKLEIFSQGEVIKLQCRFYPSFPERRLFNLEIPVFYTSALPVRFINGLWSSWFTLRRFKARHRIAPFDLMLVYNMKTAQLACANYAMRRLGLPVILEYEDDVFVDVGGGAEDDFRSLRHRRAYQRLINSVAGGMAPSPYLLSQLPARIPSLLLRGIVDEDIVAAGCRPLTARKNWLVYSGTHFRSKGLEKLIQAWALVKLPGWELHFAGRGELTEVLEKMAQGNKSIVFHGLLNRKEYAQFLGQAKIGMNPHDLSTTPGNVFAFKIIEYLAAGLHCITTPMGELEPELEAGLTYIPDNSPRTIASALERVIASRSYERLATRAAIGAYGPEAVTSSLDHFVKHIHAAAPMGKC